MQTIRFERVAGVAAAGAAAVAVFYAVTFAVFVKRGSDWAQWSSTTALALSGLVALPVLVAVYQRIRAVDEGCALVTLLVGAASAIGSSLHGAHDLAVLFNPPAGELELPNATDPRGAATFALLAVTIALSSWLLARTGLPARFAALGYLAAALLVVVYVGRLTVLDPNTSWIAVAAALSGFLAVPAWYAWLARTFLRAAAPAPAAAGTTRTAAA
jgi:hypothetical protein